MDQAGALWAVQAFDEELALALRTLGKRRLHGHTHAVDDSGGREQAARLLGRVLRQLVERGQGLGLVAGHGQRAGAPRRGTGREQLAHIGQARGQRVVALHQPVHQACGQRGLGREVFARQHELGRGQRAHQARAALRAAGAGQQAQGDLRQAQPGRWQGQAVMRGHGHLQPAAQRRAVDGADDELVAGLHAVDGFGQRGRLRRLAELADVGTGDEGLARAHDEHGARLGGPLELLDGGQQAGAHGLAQCVDGGVVDGDDQHVTVEAGLHRAGAL